MRWEIGALSSEKAPYPVGFRSRVPQWSAKRAAAVRSTPASQELVYRSFTMTDSKSSMSRKLPS